jgi:hypothetical protein
MFIKDENARSSDGFQVRKQAFIIRLFLEYFNKIFWAKGADRRRGYGDAGTLQNADQEQIWRATPLMIMAI